jgi:hypothetical protein
MGTGLISGANVEPPLPSWRAGGFGDLVGFTRGLLVLRRQRSLSGGLLAKDRFDVRYNVIQHFNGRHVNKHNHVDDEHVHHHDHLAAPLTRNSGA